MNKIISYVGFTFNVSEIKKVHRLPFSNSINSTTKILGRDSVVQKWTI